MSAKSLLPQPIATSQRELELARELFRTFHAKCLWNSPRDLEITEDLIGFVANGLRANAGHRGFLLAESLRPNAGQLRTSNLEQEAL